jgi:yecA family protein
MITFTQNDPLTDAELDRLGDFLEGCKGGKAMNIEQLDGFFAALITGPETVDPERIQPGSVWRRNVGNLRVLQPR